MPRLVYEDESPGMNNTWLTELPKCRGWRLRWLIPQQSRQSDKLDEGGVSYAEESGNNFQLPRLLLRLKRLEPSSRWESEMMHFKLRICKIQNHNEHSFKID